MIAVGVGVGVSFQQARGGNVPPPEPTLRFASSDNPIANGIISRGGSGGGGRAVALRWPHNLPTAMKSIAFVSNGWYFSAIGGGDGANDVPITSAYASCNGVVVQLTWASATSRTVLAAENNVRTDLLVPEDFGLVGEFPAGTTIWTCYGILLADPTDELPYSQGRVTGDQSGSQVIWYNPSNTTADIDNVGVITTTGSSPATDSLGTFMPWCIGEQVTPGPVWIAHGDSITQNGSDGVANQNGRCWFQIACAAIGVSCANFAINASTSNNASVSDARVKFWYDYVNRGMIFYCTNDFGTLGVSVSVVTAQTRVDAIQDALRLAGVEIVGAMMLIVESDSSNNWIDEAGQTTHLGWGAGGRPEQFNDSLDDLGFDFVVNSNVIKGTDPYKWLTNGIAQAYGSDNHHPSNGGHVRLGMHASMQMVEGAFADPSWSVIPSITGTIEENKTLTANSGTILNGLYQMREWLIDGVVVSTGLGGAAATYVPSSGDVGKDLSLRITALGPGGIATSATTPVEVQASTAAWSIRGVSTGVSVTAGGNVTAVEPVGIQQGDLLIALLDWRDTPSFSLPSGDWHLVDQLTNGNNTFPGTCSALMAYIERGASAPNLTFTRTGGTIGQIRTVAYYGQQIPAVLSAHAVARSASSTSINAAAGVTTPDANTLLVCGVASGRNLTASNFRAATSPTTGSGATDPTTAPLNNAWTERFDISVGASPQSAIQLFDAIKTVAGATGNMLTTLNNPNDSIVITAAFKRNG